MYEYKCEEIRDYAKDTENMINRLAQDNWELICSYANNTRWLIFRRKIKGGRK